jgi:hypothetical protein
LWNKLVTTRAFLRERIAGGGANGIGRLLFFFRFVDMVKGKICGALILRFTWEGVVENLTGTGVQTADAAFYKNQYSSIVFCGHVFCAVVCYA